MKVRSQPREHQIRAVSFLVQRTYGFLNYATGSGKSLISILTAFYLKNKKKISKTIIVSQKSGLLSITEDFKEHSDVTPVVLNNIVDLISFLTSIDDDFALVSYGFAAKCLMFKKVGGTVKEILSPEIIKLLNSTSTCLIFDEFHSLKNPKSKTTISWSMFRKSVTHCYGVTASSYFQDLEDLYWLCRFLNKDFFGSKTNFRDSYYNYTLQMLYGQKFPIPVVTGYKNLELLKEKLNDIMLTYTPDLNVEYHLHETFLKDRKDYLNAAKGLYEYSEETPDIKTWSARLPDLQRVINKSDEKKEALKVLASSLKSSGMIIYCAYIESIIYVKEVLSELNIEYSEITGASDTKNRKINKDWFNKNPENKCLIISDAGGQSLNLQSVNNLICYDLPFGIGKFIQIRGRIVREFSVHTKFNIHILCVKDTIDEYKYAKITQQESTYDALFGLSVANESAEFKDFNTYILEFLKKNLLWK